MAWPFYVLAIDFVAGLCVGLIKKRAFGYVALSTAFLWPLLLVVGWDTWEGCFTTNIYWEGCGTAVAVWLFPVILPARLVVLSVGLLLIKRSKTARG
jgi:hypothetical protein